MSSKDDFKCWFVGTLEPLKENGDAGFIFVMVTFPLLERYLRGKFNLGTDVGIGGSQDCCDWLNQHFPDIAGKGNDFWHAYRNGALHQATFQSQRKVGGRYVLIPNPSISGHDPRPVYYNPQTDQFFLNPIEFHSCITNIILNDFSSYERASLPLPQVYVRETSVSNIVATAGPIPSNLLSADVIATGLNSEVTSS